LTGPSRETYGARGLKQGPFRTLGNKGERWRDLRDGNARGEGKAVAPTDDFDRRLERANAQRGDAPSRGAANPSPLGLAFRIGTELVVAVAVGAVIGWLLDQWLGTHWLIVPFLLLGIGAGFRNVFRHARQMNEAAAQDAKNLPSVPDDDDDD